MFRLCVETYLRSDHLGDNASLSKASNYFLFNLVNPLYSGRNYAENRGLRCVFALVRGYQTINATYPINLLEICKHCYV